MKNKFEVGQLIERRATSDDRNREGQREIDT